jgi:hypothetical protein
MTACSSSQYLLSCILVYTVSFSILLLKFYLSPEKRTLPIGALDASKQLSGWLVVITLNFLLAVALEGSGMSNLCNFFLVTFLIDFTVNVVAALLVIRALVHFADVYRQWSVTGQYLTAIPEHRTTILYLLKYIKSGDYSGTKPLFPWLLQTSIWLCTMGGLKTLTCLGGILGGLLLNWLFISEDSHISDWLFSLIVLVAAQFLLALPAVWMVDEGLKKDSYLLSAFMKNTGRRDEALEREFADAFFMTEDDTDFQSALPNAGEALDGESAETTNRTTEEEVGEEESGTIQTFSSPSAAPLSPVYENDATRREMQMELLPTSEGGSEDEFVFDP